MSSEPKRATVWAIAPLTAASSRTSTTSGRASPPACSIAAAAEWIVPSSFGFGVSVLAAIATLAPSRAARSPIASPMPRDAPVMKRVLPWRDMVSPFAAEEGFERGLGFRRLQSLVEVLAFECNARLELIAGAAHQRAGGRDCAGWQRCDLARRLEAGR